MRLPRSAPAPAPSSGFFNTGTGGSSGFGNRGLGLSGVFNVNLEGLFGGSGYQNVGSAISGLLNLGNALSGLGRTGNLTIPNLLSGIADIGP
ncbi:hypothetical protein [Mycobacterium kansasii]|uniref:hypothetical protein n=1 Tax=Mycobacterium kansasii TaxID=1768 RepID=UPI001E51E289|nr:hypothetical protein [Mycobacterium kansasii]